MAYVLRQRLFLKFLNLDQELLGLGVGLAEQVVLCLVLVAVQQA